MTNIYNDKISYNQIFFLFGPLPKNINLLDKFEFLQYKGLRIPRIPLDENNSLNLGQLLHGDNDISNLSESKIEKHYYKDELYIPIKNDEYEYDDISSEEKSKINFINLDKSKNMTFDIKEYLFKKNSENNIKQNINYSKEYNDNLIPPKKFISIITDNNDKNSLDMIKNNYYNNINNIIKNNINKINIFTYNNIITPINFKININKNDIIKNNENIYNNRINNDNLGNNTKLLSSTFNFKIDRIKSSKEKPLFMIKSSFDSALIQEKKYQIQKVVISKRGRKQSKISKKIHGAYDHDNILRKIQVHFLSFLTNYINDVIRAFSNNKKIPLFQNIDYKIKKTVNHKYVEELKSKCIAEILQMRVSPKMKIHDDSVNKNIYNIVIKSLPFMYEFLQRSYLSLFREYFYNKNKIFIVNEKIIPISIKTKIFNDLINKNYAYKEKLKYIAISFFLNKYKKIRKPNFKIKVIKKEIDKGKG